MVSVQESFDNFIVSRLLADLAERSIKDYREFIAPFVRFVGSERDLGTIEQKDIDGYIFTLLERPLSRSSRGTYIRHIKIYLKWCEERYTVLYQSKLIKIPKTPKKQVRIYTLEEIKEIFDNIRCDAEWLTLRNKAMIALMYDSGLRQAELCSLRHTWLSIPQKRLKVHGKGDKERYVPLGNLTVRYLEQYLAECPYKSEKIFVNRHGEDLTCNAVKLMVTKLASCLTFELSSHKLRHNFATNYCIDQYEKHGRVDIYSLMYIMGHENIETTRRYLHLAMEIVASKESISHLDSLFL